MKAQQRKPPKGGRRSAVFINRQQQTHTKTGSFFLSHSPFPPPTTVLHDGHHGPSSTVLDKLVDWNGQIEVDIVIIIQNHFQTYC